jgi:hypothetical protein
MEASRPDVERIFNLATETFNVEDDSQPTAPAYILPSPSRRDIV